MKFRTEIQIRPLPVKIGYSDSVLLLGSCFADRMRERLHERKFRAAGNFTGPLFNPASVAELLRRAENPDPDERGALHRGDDGWWFHYDMNSLADDPDPRTVLRRRNESLEAIRSLLPAARHLVVTFGTAWVYRLRETGRIVANCHRQPQALFIRERLTVREIVDRWSELLLGALADKEVIFTVSPIRHLGDGLEDNCLSKALLRVAAAELEARFAHVHYFPAYEILTDDLRDYRFYAEDLVHPSPQAVQYIWERFAAAALSEEALAVLPEVERIAAMCRHRPRRRERAEYRELCRRTLCRIAELEKSHGIDFSEEIAFLGEETYR